MRQSLSERVATVAAVALSAALGLAAIVDQIGGRSLADHASATYAPYGNDPSAGLLYGLVYSIAAVDLLLFLVVLRRRTRVMAIVTVLVTASLALTLLFVREYGQPIYPSIWGLLALLPPIAGAFAAIQLLRRSLR